MATTMLVTHYRTPVPRTVTTKQGKTQYGARSDTICSGPGRKHQMHLHKVWDTNILQRQQDP